MRSINSCHSSSVASTSLAVRRAARTIRQVCGHPLCSGFGGQIQQQLGVCLTESQDLNEVVQFLHGWRRPPVIFDVAHIDRRHLQLCCQSAQGQPAGHSFLPHITAECLLHCGVPPICSLFRERLCLVYTPPSHAARGQTRGAPFMGHLALFLNMGIHLAFFRVRR